MSSVQLDSNFTCIAFLGDNSGSMTNFNTIELADNVNNIVKEANENSEVIFYGATFSDMFNLFADGISGDIVNVTSSHLKPNGMTSLVPAFARMIRIVGSRLSDMTDRRPGKVIFILLSDGEQTVKHLINRDEDDSPYENADGITNLRNLVQQQETVYSWEFMFIGTNFDSLSVGSQLGLSRKQCINFANSDGGMRNVMRCVSQNVSRLQSNITSGFTDVERFESMVIMDDNKNVTLAPNV